MNALQQQINNARQPTRLEQIHLWLAYARRRAKERRTTIYVFTPLRGCFSLVYDPPGPQEVQHSHVVTWDRVTGKTTVTANEETPS